MTTHTDILTLTQWLSPSFPVGAFAYSHGLETAIADGTLCTARDFESWLADILEAGSGRNDCILLHNAYAAETATELQEIDAYASANTASSERLRETQLQGAAFCQTARAIWGGDTPSLTYPVAVGAAARLQGFDPTLTASMYLQAFASNLISVAIRAVPLGQTEGQAALASLNPLCDRISRETSGEGLDDLSSTAFLSDIAAMRHETLPVRIFRS